MSPALPALGTEAADARVVHLRTQYPEGLIGVPTAGLRLSWQAQASSTQLGYQVAWSGGQEGTSDPVASDAAIGVPAPGPVLVPGETRRYAVRIATAQGWSAWSEPVEVESSIDPTALVATPIGGSQPVEGPVMIFRRDLDLSAAPVRARLRATFWGIGEVRINGRAAFDEHLAPGWTAYDDRVLLGTWDVTSLLREGANTIGALLADGWYRGRLGWTDGTEHYGSQAALLAQLEIDCADGSRVVVGTSPEWTTSTGSILSASLYDGVEIDLRNEPIGWQAPGFDDSGWAASERVDVDLTAVEPRITGGVRTVAEWPVEPRPIDGRTDLDLGQNIAGWLRLVVSGAAGDRVVVRHAEVLEPDGTLHVAALRTAKATDVYVLAHDGETVLEPSFTFHGFQYADVTGAEVVSATAVAISSADIPRSTFASSAPLLERLHSNVAWSQRDNFVSLPTDCPQRDERLGWTGDAQAFAPTASTLFDVESFWMSWLRDLELDQDAEGGVANVVPDILSRESDGHWPTTGRAGWGDAATIVPWAVYESYGSDEVLARQLDSMRRWVGSLERRAGGGLLPTEFQFGDWLDPDAPGDQPWAAKTSADFVANAFFARSAELLADAEVLVGDRARGEAARELSRRVAAQTWSTWGDEAIATQTGAAIALEFRIAPEEARERVAAELARNVRDERGRIATGFLGTPLVLFALTHAGYVDEAYLMLLRTEAPSWLYQVEMGATTVWERWDALAPDGSIHSGEMATGDSSGMLSFNHYAYGAVIDWVYRYVAGLGSTPDAPGYRRILVSPRPSTAVTWARASIDTRLGAASVDWRSDAGRLELDLVVPFGAEAVLDLALDDGATVEVDGRDHDGAPLGPGPHRVVANGVRVADPGVIAQRLPS